MSREASYQALTDAAPLAAMVRWRGMMGAARERSKPHHQLHGDRAGAGTTRVNDGGVCMLVGRSSDHER